jgi:hypothetical protein
MSLSPVYPTPTKAASIPFVPSGVYRARVVNVRGALVDIEIPRLTGDLLHTNIEVLGAPNTPMLAPRDLCYVAFVEGYQDSLVVLGNVRLPSTAGPGLSFGANGIDPLEEYATARDGSLTVGGSFRWPVRRAAQITQLVATMKSNDGTGDTVIELVVSNIVLGTIVIPSGTVIAYATLDAQITAGEILTFNITSVGSGANGLFVAARGRAINPDTDIFIDEYVFGFGGNVTTGQSHLYPLRRNVTFKTIIATISSIGADNLDIAVSVAGTPIGNISILEGDQSANLTVSALGNVDDLLTVDITSAPIGATNLAVFVRGS